MTPQEARQLLHDATSAENGTLTKLRLGVDPGEQQIAKLKRALRVLWLHWKGQPALPFDIAGAAGKIVYFTDESERNIREGAATVRASLLRTDLPSLAACASFLLRGPDVGSDLGSNGEFWRET